MPDSFDVLVIGAGPGGYVCAIRAAQLGLKVACAEKRATLGGTCLNVGCIPSKALLFSSELYERAVHDFAQHGILTAAPTLDLARMQARKAEVVAANVKGVEFLFRKNKITWLKGEATILAPGRVRVAGEDYDAKHIVIATGSEPAPLPPLVIDEQRILTSTGALELLAVPEHLVVIGGGVIGLELGSVWRRLGAKVTVIEYLEAILPGMDGEVRRQFERILSKQGMHFRLRSKVTAARLEGKRVAVTVEPVAGGAAETIHADAVLVAVGRRPHLSGLGLEAVGVALDERGRIRTDAHFATTVPGIYAIGDVIAGPMLAHKAEDEGYALAEMLAGQKPHITYAAIPSVVYTAPEVAAVGATEEELSARGIAYKVGRFPFTANGRARAIGATEGFVKVLADKATDRILGAHIIGPEAGTLIAEFAMALEFSASAEDVARISHAHPSLNEAVREAAMAAWDRPVHL